MSRVSDYQMHCHLPTFMIWIPENRIRLLTTRFEIHLILATAPLNLLTCRNKRFTGRVWHRQTYKHAHEGELLSLYYFGRGDRQMIDNHRTNSASTQLTGHFGLAIEPSAIGDSKYRSLSEHDPSNHIGIKRPCNT